MKNGAHQLVIFSLLIAAGCSEPTRDAAAPKGPDTIYVTGEKKAVLGGTEQTLEPTNKKPGDPVYKIIDKKNADGTSVHALVEVKK